MFYALVEDCCDIVMKEGVKMSDSGIVFPIDELVDKTPTSLRDREKIMSHTCILERFCVMIVSTVGIFLFALSVEVTWSLFQSSSNVFF